MVAARYGYTRAKRGQIEKTNDMALAWYDDIRGNMRIDREDERHGLAWYSEIRGKMRTGGDSG